MQKLSTFFLFAALALVTACGGSGGTSMPRNVPMPEDAANPIILKFEGGYSHTNVINVVASALSSQGIPTLRVSPEEGLIETRWLDMATWDPTRGSAMLPANERSVLFLYQAGRGVNPETQEVYGMGLVASAFYQPDPNRARTQPRTYREQVPTNHYGYQLLLRVQTVILQKLTEAGIPYELIQPNSIGGMGGS
ncbi:MAG TPA: hypothetical protein VLC48_09970 [Gemmatimonadota bacterium]|nr:hypothetical protein [Gemmatimonadota bacterium]